MLTHYKITLLGSYSPYYSSLYDVICETGEKKRLVSRQLMIEKMSYFENHSLANLIIFGLFLRK